MGYQIRNIGRAARAATTNKGNRKIFRHRSRTCSQWITRPLLYLSASLWCSKYIYFKYILPWQRIVKNITLSSHKHWQIISTNERRFHYKPSLCEYAQKLGTSCFQHKSNFTWCANEYNVNSFSCQIGHLRVAETVQAILHIVYLIYHCNESTFDWFFQFVPTSFSAPAILTNLLKHHKPNQNW